MKLNQITAVLMGLIILFLVVYDLVMLFLDPNATFSVLINQWAFQAHPLLVFCFGIIFGGLIVHFLKWAPLDEQVSKKNSSK